jgi:tape measure domain-containing protein
MSSTGIPGVYVEVRGDYTHLQKEMKEARAMVKRESVEISNSLNNALSPTQINRNINAMVGSLGTLNRASSTTGKAFDDLGLDLKTLSKNTGLSEKEFGSLQSRMLQTRAAKTQERALVDIAKSADLSTREVKALGKQFDLSEAQIKKVTTQLDRFGASAKRNTSSVSLLSAVTKGFLAYLGVTQIWEFSKASFDAAMALDSWQRSTVAITGSQRGMREEMTVLREIASDTGQNFYKLTDSYRQLEAATKGTALSTADTQRIFKSVSEAAAVLGLSSHRTGLAIEALSQMASKGKVSMEELRRQLGDHIPGALGIAARAMDVPIKELYRMVQAGELMASDLLPRLGDELHKMYGEAAKTAALDSGQAAVNRLSQAWTDFKVNVVDIEATVSAINKVTAAIEWLGEKAELRSVWGTFTEGAQLARKGLLDFEEFSKATFTERQEMVDALTRTEKVSADHFVSVWAEAERQNLRDYEAFEIKKAELQANSEGKGYQALQKYIETNQQRLEREYHGLVKFAKTDQERAAATAVYNKALEGLATKTERAAVKASYAGDEYASFTQELALMASAGVNAGSQLALIEQNMDSLGKAGDEWAEKNAEAVKKQSTDRLSTETDLQNKIKSMTLSEVEYKKWSLDQEVAQLREFAGSNEEMLAQISEYHALATDEIESGHDELAEFMAARYDEAFDGMQDNLVDWMKTGEISFSSFGDLFENMLYEMVAAYAMSGVKDVFNELLGLGSGGSSGGSSSGIIGGLVDMGSSALDWVGGIFGFADGGQSGVGGVLQGGSGKVDDLYMGTVNGRAQIAMGGEYFMPQKQTAKFFPILEKMRADKFADGGVSGVVPWLPQSGSESYTSFALAQTSLALAENVDITKDSVDAVTENISITEDSIVSADINSVATDTNSTALDSLSSGLDSLGERFSAAVSAFADYSTKQIAKAALVSVVASPVVGLVSLVSSGLSNSASAAFDSSIGHATSEDLSYRERSDIEDAYGSLDSLLGSDGDSSSSSSGGFDADRESVAGGMGGYARGTSSINKLWIPSNDDGYAGYKLGERVVPDRLNNDLTAYLANQNGGNSETNSLLRQMIALLSADRNLNVDGKSFRSYVSSVSDNTAVDKARQGVPLTTPVFAS